MKSACSFAVVAVLSLSIPAYADPVPPDVWACQGKVVGAACVVDGGAGVCQAATCTKLVMVDGSSTPMQVSCSSCVKGLADGGSGAGGSGAGGQAASDDGSCAIGSGGRVSQVGPWLLAGVFSLLFLVRRRRRRSS